MAHTAVNDSLIECREPYGFSIFFSYIFLSFVRLTVTNSLEDVARNQVKISKQFNDPEKMAKLPSDSSRYYITSKYNKQNTRVLRVYV